MYKEPLDENTAYFHASWHRENPCDGWGPDLQVNCPEVNNVVNLKGDGNYVILDVEGTDMFFIDGEEYPSLNGTGTEDYFNHAWGMQRNAFPFYGTIVHEGDTDGFHVAYRFHITDPVRFEKHLKVTIEHGHANHLSDDWSSTAYWYQTLPTSKPLTILPVEERLPNVPVLPERKQKMPELADDMKAARESYKKRWEEYYPEREEQFRIKEDKARRESRLNTEFAKKLRKEYDEEN